MPTKLVYDADFSDFCLCTFARSEQHNLFIERIEHDNPVWAECLSKLHNFSRCHTPRVVGQAKSASLTRQQKTVKFFFASCVDSVCVNDMHLSSLLLLFMVSFCS